MTKNNNIEDLDLGCKYVTVEIRKLLRKENGELYETVEEVEVPDFVAEVLTGMSSNNSFFDSFNEEILK